MSIWKEIQKAINSDFTTEPLNDKTDRIETKVDTVDTVVDTINTNVGSNADSASATGSVHAKLKDLKSLKVLKKPYITIYSNTTPASGTFYTIVNITSNSGALQRLSVATANENNTGTNIRFTIDGIAYTYTDFIINLAVCSFTEQSIGGNVIDIIQSINFESSLKVEVSIDGTTADIFSMVEYTLT